MSEKLNLSELLKGKEGLALYSPLCGDCTLKSVKPRSIKSDYADAIIVERNGNEIGFRADGKCFPNGKLMLFVTPDCYNSGDNYQSWEMWKESQLPKTWEELVNSGEAKSQSAEISGVTADYKRTLSNYKVEHSAIALMKIRQLIEKSYGGNPKFYEKKESRLAFIAFEVMYSELKLQNGEKFKQVVNIRPYVETAYDCIDPIAFYTIDQANRFISHPSNVELLKDFYMI